MAERMSEARTGLIGGALVSLGPVSMVLYTPSMPTLVAAFATSEAMVKLTLTTYFAGFACTQLIIGPLSDAFGRRPVALTLLVFYLLATTLAMLAPTIEWMLAARLLQGMCAAVGVVIARAIVRDQFTGQASARVMNVIIMLLAVSPALAPFIGGITVELAGWQAVFMLMIGYGVALVALVLVSLPETNVHRDAANLQPRRLARNYLSLLGDVRFLRPSLVIGLTIGCVYVFATLLPFVLIDRVGLSPSQYGIAMLAQGSALLAGTITVSRLLRRVEAERLVPWGLAIALVTGAFLAIALPLASPTVALVMVPIAVLSFGISFIFPAMATAAVAGFPAIAGAASALMGFMQIGGGLAGSAVAAAIGDPVTGLATVLPAMPLLATLVYLGLRRAAARPGGRQAHEPGTPVPPA